MSRFTAENVAQSAWHRLGPVAALVLVAGCGGSGPLATGAPVVGATSRVSASTGIASSPKPTDVGTTVVVKSMPADAAPPVAWDAPGATTARPSTFAPAVAPDGSIWVASGHDSVFWIYNSKGHLTGTWGTAGKGAGQLNLEYDHEEAYGGGAFAGDGSFYVLDTGNNRVQHVAADRHDLGPWGAFGSGPGDFSKATGIAVAPDGSVYVADSDRLDIQQFEADGTFVREIGAGQAGDSPYYATVAIGRGGHVFTNNGQSVLEYDTSGNLLTTIDLTAFGVWPVGLALDGSGDLFVLADAGIAPSDHPAATLELGPDNSVLHSWAATGESLALDPAGGAAYVAFYQWTSLRKYLVPATK